MNKILISICITAFNVEKYIKQCLDSIIKYESSNNIEIIVINDSSTDNTDNEIKNWILKNNGFSQIKYLLNDTNLGQVKSLIKAVNYSNGEFLTFLDADDFLINSTFKNKLLSFDNNLDLKVVYGNGCFYENGKYYGNVHANIIPILKKGIFETKKYINSNTPMLSLSCMIIKKDFFKSIGGFDETGKSNDWITNIKIFNNISNNNEVYIDTKFAFAYRMHNNNISKNPEFQLNLLLHVINYHCDNKYRVNNISNAYYITALRYLLINDYKKGFENIFKSIKVKFNLLRLFSFIILLFTPKIFIKRFPNIISVIKQYILKYFQ